MQKMALFYITVIDIEHIEPMLMKPNIIGTAHKDEQIDV